MIHLRVPCSEPGFEFKIRATIKILKAKKNPDIP
jgi:hypothetical protein